MIEGEKRTAAQAWCKSVVGKVLLNLPTRTVGKVVKFHDGDESKYLDPNGVEVTDPVVLLDKGDAFLADPEGFIEFTETDAEVFYKVQDAVCLLLSGAWVTGAMMKIEEHKMVGMIQAILRAQIAEMKRKS